MARARNSISFRDHDVGGGFRLTPRVVPASALGAQPHILLLIHGFNNDAFQASDAYEAFVDAQILHCHRLFAHIVEVYWPGDTSLTGYHYSIDRAKTTARILAAELERSAGRHGRLAVDVVAHSMGCRLTLELINELQSGTRTVKVRRVAFMAAAVPIRQLDGTPLRTSFEAEGTRALSQYSPSDEALGAAFRIGQWRADVAGIDDSGNPRIALGAAEWRAAPRCASMDQTEAVNALHGDYWPDRGGYVATRIHRHLGLGGIVPMVEPRTPRQRFVLTRRIAEGVLRTLRVRSR